MRMLNGQMEAFCHGDPRRAALVVLRATIYPSLTHRVSTKTMPIKGQFMQRRALKDKSGTFSGNRFNGTPLCLPHLASGRMTCKKLLDINHISDTFQHRKLPETPSPSPMIDCPCPIQAFATGSIQKPSFEASDSKNSKRGVVRLLAQSKINTISLCIRQVRTISHLTVKR